jgi:hypothetical protein
VDSTGVYSGVIVSPQNRDVFRITLEERGDFVTVAPTVSAAEGRFRVQVAVEEGTVTELHLEGGEGSLARAGGRDWHHEFRSPGGGVSETSWEIWAEEPSQLCVRVYENFPDESELPYEWQLLLSENDPDPVPVPGSRLPDVVLDREELLQNVDERVSELDERVAALEERVAALEG